MGCTSIFIAAKTAQNDATLRNIILYTSAAPMVSARGIINHVQKHRMVVPRHLGGPPRSDARTGSISDAHSKVGALVAVAMRSAFSRA